MKQCDVNSCLFGFVLHNHCHHQFRLDLHSRVLLNAFSMGSICSRFVNILRIKLISNFDRFAVRHSKMMHIMTRVKIYTLSFWVYVSFTRKTINQLNWFSISSVRVSVDPLYYFVFASFTFIGVDLYATLFHRFFSRCAFSFKS